MSSDKKLYIMRGISGSGKSTLARSLAGRGQIFSTDDFFMKNGRYQFDRNKLGLYHSLNQKRAIDAMTRGVSPIVIDNTHTEAWEAKIYVMAGLKHGYDIEVVEPNTSWKFDAEELAKKNSHGVPLDAIKRMLDRWQPDITVDDIVNSKREK